MDVVKKLRYISSCSHASLSDYVAYNKPEDKIVAGMKNGETAFRMILRQKSRQWH